MIMAHSRSVDRKRARTKVIGKRESPIIKPQAIAGQETTTVRTSPTPAKPKGTFRRLINYFFGATNKETDHV
jgi:hypothetical protein